MSVRTIRLLQRFLHFCEHQTHTNLQQFHMNFLKQIYGSVGKQPVSGVCLMMAFYCSRRSRSSKLSFCSPQGTWAAAVSIHSALCFSTREEVGQAYSHRNVFSGRGELSVDTIILLFCPFVLKSGKRVNPVGWDVTTAVSDADQIAFLVRFSIVPVSVNESVCV